MRNEFMSAIALSVGLSMFLTGCSSPSLQSESEYDQIEVILWETCLNEYLTLKRGTDWVSAVQATQSAEAACAPYKPGKR